jgi:predicted  nucleic acid-binding Zn-ribbon protein
MAWFNNHYECARCGSAWSDEWSYMCDDDCPHCGARHMTPTESDDLTEISDVQDSEPVLLRSSA